MSCSDFDLFCGIFKNSEVSRKSEKLFYSTSVQKTILKYKCRERKVQGQPLHINLYCTAIEYHTDRTLCVRRMYRDRHI